MDYTTLDNGLKEPLKEGGWSRGDRPPHPFYDHAKAFQGALPPPETVKKSRERLTENFNSVALSFEGSEAIRQVRHFVNSCLLTADKKKEDLVAKLGCDETNLLSFQCVIIPFLALLTRTTITGLLSVLETLIQRKSLDDQRLSSDAILRYDPDSFIPISFFQPSLTIRKLIFRILLLLTLEASEKQRLSEPKSEAKDNPGTKYKAIVRKENFRFRSFQMNSTINVIFLKPTRNFPKTQIPLRNLDKTNLISTIDSTSSIPFFALPNSALKPLIAKSLNISSIRHHSSSTRGPKSLIEIKVRLFT
ncbi:hypothetical protein G9A89_014706 [Geosiphon pyriformis]|nr:hypothetical protein G9A89_014706 [Geosiphon pyriformis]